MEVINDICSLDTDIKCIEIMSITRRIVLGSVKFIHIRDGTSINHKANKDVLRIMGIFLCPFGVFVYPSHGRVLGTKIAIDSNGGSIGSDNGGHMSRIEACYIDTFTINQLLKDGIHAEAVGLITEFVGCFLIRHCG